MNEPNENMSMPLPDTLCEENCVICRNPLDNDKQRVYKKGLETLLRVSQLKGDVELHEYLLEKSLKSPIGNVYVHKMKRCRADYTELRRSRPDDDGDGDSTSKRLRSSVEPFDWTADCFLCGKAALIDERHPSRDSVSHVTLLGVRETILQQCTTRDDPWAYEVMTRVNDCIDLVAAEAQYHSKCYRDFFRFTHAKIETVGRPADFGKQHWFEAVCHWLDEEGETETLTVSDIYEKMKDLANGSEIYGIKSLRDKLYEHYGDHIFWSRLKGGREDVLCFQSMASYIVHETWHADRINDAAQEAERIVVTCANLLKQEIRGCKYSKEMYPSNNDIKDINRGREFLTPLTRIFMETMIRNDVRRNSIGQALTQAVRPSSVISPILFGTAIEMDHVFGSRWLVDELFRLGFSISYDEVTLFKQSILQEENLSTLQPNAEAEITLWSCDNADHAVRTIDGFNQFHGMGTIAMSAIKGDLVNVDQYVRRRTRVAVSDLMMDKGIPIVPYIGSYLSGLSCLKFKTIEEIQQVYIAPPVAYYANLIWQSARLLGKPNTQIPNYSGYMQHFFRSLDDGVVKWQVLILPFIDLNPNDETCLHSVLLYIQEQSCRLMQPCACITFDQPLWQKAVDIIKSIGLNRIVCRLGGFHLLMSACGSVGNLMKGSGLEEAMGQVYGPNTVSHMLTGKSIARALRAHFLVEKALMTKLVSDILPLQCEQSNKESFQNIDKLTMDQLRTLQELFDRVSKDGVGALNDVLDSEELSALEQCLLKHKSNLENNSRTAKYWILYLYYINTVKTFMQCERICDWEGHLAAAGKLLNLFAASGHINYAKSARLYLQMMRELPNEQPWLYQKFVEGYHAVRRSEKYWAGLWTDLCIEQILMRSMKARGGLTHGRGITESVRHQWIYSMHHCAGIHDAMTSLTNCQHVTSDQHTELGKSRCKRDSADLEKILNWFEQHNPFDDEVSALRSLSSGLTATDEDAVTCDQAEAIGKKIQQSLDGVAFNSAHIKRSEQVRTLEYLQPGVKIGKKSIQIEPSVLFMRCMALASRESEDVKSYFKYELSAVPASLFKDYFMRKPEKAELAREIKKELTNLSSQANAITKESMPVIDGGWLLHHIRWKRDATYKQVAEQYESYLKNRFGMCCVVFDGYEGPSTKDHEHLRRSGTRSADITLDGNAKCHKDQHAFLSNVGNKTQFLELLTCVLQSKGHIIKASDGDADTLIVSSALNFSQNGQSVLLVAEDTDIFIMLIHHWEDTMADIFLMSGKGVSTSKKHVELYSIRETHQVIHPVLRDNILFIHAWSGCDTTSSTFGQGKTHLMKVFPKCNTLQQLSHALINKTIPHEVGPVGMSIFCRLYGGNDHETLTNLRYIRYQSMVARCNKIEPERLPPTERAAYYHSLRVHLQIKQWAELNNNCLNPYEWGWKLERNRMCPVLTDLDVAPESVIKFIRCKCKVSNKHQCASNQCSCRKSGLKCVAACGGCHGETCHNRQDTIICEDEDDDVEENVAL